MAIYSGNTIYSDSTVTYNDAGVQYGGVKDDVIIKGVSVADVKPANILVVDTKPKNMQVIRSSETQTYYQRILAGMPIGLLLSLTYPVDQDGEERT